MSKKIFDNQFYILNQGRIKANFFRNGWLDQEKNYNELCLY
jgi:hypothetical protein